MPSLVLIPRNRMSSTTGANSPNEGSDEAKSQEDTSRHQSKDHDSSANDAQEDAPGIARKEKGQSKRTAPAAGTSKRKQVKQRKSAIDDLSAFLLDVDESESKDKKEESPPQIANFQDEVNHAQHNTKPDDAVAAKTLEETEKQPQPQQQQLQQDLPLETSTAGISPRRRPSASGGYDRHHSHRRNAPPVPTHRGPGYQDADSQLLGLMIELAGQQGDATARMSTMSEQIEKKEKNNEMLLSILLQTQKTVEELRNGLASSAAAVAAGAIMQSNDGRIMHQRRRFQRIKSIPVDGEPNPDGSNKQDEPVVIEYEENDYDDNNGEYEETPYETIKNLRTKITSLKSKRSISNAENKRLERENSDLRKINEENKATMKSCENQMRDMNANYSGALTRSQLHFEQEIFAKDKAIARLECELDKLNQEYEALEQDYRTVIQQTRANRVVEAKGTIASLKSGKMMGIGGGATSAMGGMQPQYQQQQTLNTEALRKAAKASASNSFFECIV